MKRITFASLLLFLAGLGLHAGLPQRDESARKIESPRAIRLPGGSRVEFENFFAPALGKSSNYSVFLPPSHDKPSSKEGCPVVYFLHGMWNDHTSWAVERYGSIPERMEQLMLERRVPEFLLVSPDGENSFYTDYLDGSLRFEQLIVKDLIEVVQSRYQVSGNSRHRAIAGVSMGGYGALKIAMKHPDLYASVAAVSPIVFFGQDPSAAIVKSESRFTRYFQAALQPIYGIPFDPEHWRENSLEILAQSTEVKDLNIYFSYGTADRYNSAFPMREGVELLSGLLKERNIPHVFRVVEDGPHGWDLVKEELEEVLLFVTQTF